MSAEGSHHYFFLKKRLEYKIIFAAQSELSTGYMYSKNWMVIKDDSKRTFEVYGHATNTNSFTNEIYGMQKAGMNVSCVTPPVTNKASSKEIIKITGYAKEEGLYEKLLKQYREITRRSFDEY